MKSEIDQLQNALEAAPDHWDTRRHLAERFYDDGDFENAARVIAEAPSFPEDEAEQIFAARLAASANPAKAHEILDAVIADNPACADAHDTKADIYEAHDQPEQAAKHHQAAAALGGGTASEEGGVIQVSPEDIEEAAASPPIEVDSPSPHVTSNHHEETPSPAVPRKLTPPSSKSESAASPTDPTTPGAAPSPLTGAVAPPTLVELEPEPDLLAGVEGHLSAAEIASLESEEEQKLKRIARKNKLSSVLISVVVHAALLLLLGIIIIAVPRLNPPEIVAVAAPPTDTPPDPDKKKVQPTYAKQTKPASKIVQVLAATDFSSVAVPIVVSPPPEDLTPGLSMEDGFGMGISFTGSTDAWINSLPSSVQSRCSLVERMNRLKVGGAGRKCEDAVRRSLVWLHENQNEDGSWGKTYPVAMTGLALLSYLGHCETPDSPEFADTVVNAATYLMDAALKSPGPLASPNGKPSYEHGIATYALCELFTLSRRGQRKIPDLDAILQKMVPMIIKGQNANGSWNYKYKGPRSDTSVTGWQMQALQAASHSALKFDGLDKSFEMGLNYLRSVQGPKGGFGYDDRDDRISLVGVGVLAFQFAGQGDGPEAQKGIDYILKNRKSLSYASINFYEWYYTTQACFQESSRAWRKWNDMFLDPLIEAQERDGHWPKERSDQTNKQAKGDGDVYRTCLATLMLEVYYRYLPTGEKLKK